MTIFNNETEDWIMMMLICSDKEIAKSKLYNEAIKLGFIISKVNFIENMNKLEKRGFLKFRKIKRYNQTLVCVNKGVTVHFLKLEKSIISDLLEELKKSEGNEK